MAFVQSGFPMGDPAVTMGLPADRLVCEQMEPSGSDLRLAVSRREGLGHRRPDMSLSVPISDVRIPSCMPGQGVSAEVAGSVKVPGVADSPMVAGSAMETASEHISVRDATTLSSLSGPVVPASLGPYSLRSGGTQPTDDVFGEERFGLVKNDWVFPNV